MADIEPELRSGFRGIVEPIDYLSSTEQRVFARENEKEAAPITEVIGKAIDNQWLSNAGARLYNRSEDFSIDPNFVVDKERMEPYELEFRHEDRNYIAEAKSDSDFNARIGWVREDVARNQEMASYGKTGVIAELAAAVFDPVGWGVGLITGPVGLAGKGATMMRSLRGASVIGAEAAGYEAILAASDTQRDPDDILFAATAGLLIGGGLGAAIRKGDKAPIAKAADDLDSALKAEGNSILTRELQREVDEATSIISPTTVKDKIVSLDDAKIARTIDDHVTQLEETAKGGLRGKASGLIKKQVLAANEEIKVLNAKFKEHKAKVASGFGAPRNTSEHARNQFRFRSIENLYQPKIDKLTNEVEALTGRLDGAKAASEAKKELKSFRELGKVDQIHRVFPTGAPKLSHEIERQIKAIKETSVKPLDEDTIKAAQLDEVAEDGTQPPNAGNAGSMRTRFADVYDDYFTTGETMEDFVTGLVNSLSNIPSRITVKYKALGDKLQSTFSTLDHSENMAFRGLAHKLLENPQGNILPQDTASILSFTFDKKIRSSIRNRYNEGFEEWSAAAGRNMGEASIDKGKWRDKFDKEVYLKVADPKRPADAYVTKAADGLRDGFDMALTIRREAGEAGFENIKSDRRYIPRLFDGQRMTAMATKYSKELVTRVLAKGYETGGIKLKPHLAEKMAEIQYVRTMGSTLSARHVFESVVSQAERQRFLDELVEAGVDKNTIADFIADKELKELANSVSSRAKHSLYINPTAEMEGLSVIDLLSHDISTISESYIRESAGGAAMATHGFKSQQQAMQVIDSAEMYGRNLDLGAKRMGEEAEMLKDSVKMMYGQSIEVNPTGGIEVGTRRAREFTGLIRLGMLGFAQFPEAARMIANLGLSNVLSSVKGTAIFRRRAARGGKTSGVLSEPELKEIEELLGYVGEDNWLRPLNIRHEDFGEGVGGELGRLYDNAMAAGTRVNAVASGFQAIQGGFEKIAMRGIKKRLIEMAEGKKWDNGLTTEAGFTPEFMDELGEFLRTNPKFEKFNGRDVRLMNFNEMTPAMRQKLMIGMTRMSGRMIQKNFIGETSTFMNKWLGKTLTQFRTFSIVSAEKQLIHDLRGDKIKAAQILGWSALLGYITYGAQVHLKALGEEDGDKFIEEKMSGQSLSFGVFQKMPQPASISLGADVLATFGALPDSMYAVSGRGGVRPMTVGAVAPIIGTGLDAVGLTNSVVDMITGGDSTPKQVVEKARRLIPLANTIGTGQLLKAGINEL